MRKIAILIVSALLCISCQEVEKKYTQKKKVSKASENYWDRIQSLCGKSFEGKLNHPKEDTVFGEKSLIMHVRKCEDGKIKIPFFVGEDKSRTWILSKKNGKIELKHDHRHSDGSPKEITMYGGLSTNVGFDSLQVFPADQKTAELLPAAAGNIWWMTITDSTFSYNLRRMGSDRLFTVTFDLTQALEPPAAPWGWEE